MKRQGRLLSFFLVLALVSGWGFSPTVAEDKQEESLYKRLGGYDAIALVVEDFFGRMVPNEQLGKYFIGLSTDSKRKAMQLTVDFVCSATGGPCLYTGRDMKTSHTGLGITESDWDLSVKLLTETLDKFKVPDKEKGELLNLVGSLKGQIVEQ